MAKKAISTKVLYRKLDELFEASPNIEMDGKKRFVIFSDLHMGDGGTTDDFSRNSNLFISALEKFYLPDHTLILNGDVEELQRFSVENIYKKWKNVYNLFDQFSEKGQFYKTIGNHDLELLVHKKLPFDYNHLEGVKLTYGDDHLFIYHGHQASKKYQQHNELIGFTLKYFANPLRIKSYSVSHSSRKQYKIEKRVHGYSTFNKIVSVIGHTHRPLFESLHKVERLKSKIEHLCREFAEATNSKAKEIEATIKTHRKELKKYYRNNEEVTSDRYVYDSLVHIPCLFNSGCVVGKRGITCLEIEGDQIRLVHWFDKNISKKYLSNSGYEPEQLADTDYYRVVINEESLNYIFARINLLA